VPRKRRSGLSALIKAFTPPKPRKRRSKPRSTVPKAVRAATRAATASTRAATAIAEATAPKPARKPTRTAKSRPKSVARKPAARKPPAIKPAARRQVRKSAGSAPSSTGRGTWRQARFTGLAGSRSYRVYIPIGLRRTTKAPLLMALHGCGQGGLDFAVSTRFSELADKHKFLVVYPEQSATQNAQKCWNWFRVAHQFRSQGEPAILAGIVRRVTQETTAWRVDPERVYVAGISAGGAMSVVLAATYPELFAAVGVHSAPPYRSASGPANAFAAMQGGAMPPPVEAPAREPMPPMIVFHGTVDGTVRSVNAQRIAEQWLHYYDHDASRHVDRKPVGRPRTATTNPARPASPRSRRGYQVTRWSVSGRRVLEVWIVDGLGHAWSGGSPKGSYSDSRGPRASTEMWKFFSAHRRATAAAEIRVS
jgi:poly(hydroxyalkanoate) depolymerase family esterase